MAPPKHLSYHHAINSIKLMYQHAGFELPNHALGEQVAQEYGMVACDTKLAPLYAFVDEQIALLRLTSFYFLSGYDKKNERAMTYYKISISQLKSLASIRLLCANGLDTNARLQLRLLYENSILWSKFRVDLLSLDEYSKCDDQTSANAFWHKHMSRSKVESFLAHEFAASGHMWLGSFDEMTSNLKKITGLTAHPTFVASKFESSFDWKNFDERVALSVPSDASHFTLTQAIFVAAIPFCIKPDPVYPFKTQSLLSTEIPLKPLAHKTDSWDEYNQILRDMLPRLYLMSTRFSDELRPEK